MKLSEFFEQNRKCALGYSGGVDSTFLLYSAIKADVDIKPYFVKSAFTTENEYKAAIDFASKLGCKVSVINFDVLALRDVIINNENRCYYCKKAIFSAISEYAAKDGYNVIIEGTNASDDISDRPGFKAICELGVVSPLKLCGITKDEIRSELKKAGFDIWNKPATACLATRIPTNTEISLDDLIRVYKCEKILYNIGFSDFRVRIFNGAARIQLKSDDFSLALYKRKEIFDGFKPYFNDVFLDFKER